MALEPDAAAPGPLEVASAASVTLATRAARAGRRPSLRRGPLVIGQRAPLVEPRLAARDPYRPDTIADGGRAFGLTVRAASVRGLGKRYGGGPRQDDLCLRWHEPTRTLIAAVADGVSAATRSDLGAALAVRHVTAALARQLDERADPATLDWDHAFSHATWALIEEHRRATANPQATVEDANATLASTLLVAVIGAGQEDGTRAQLASVGDSSALQWTAASGFRTLLAAAERDDGLLAPATKALPRATVPTCSLCCTLQHGDVLLLATDGLALPLAGGDSEVGEVFARELRRPPDILDFARLLDFSRSSYDDDRSLVAVWSVAEPQP